LFGKKNKWMVNFSKSFVTFP